MSATGPTLTRRGHSVCPRTVRIATVTGLPSSGSHVSVHVLIVSEQADERARALSFLAAQDDVIITEADSPGAATIAMDAQSMDVVVVDADMTPKGGTSWLYELHGQAEQHGFVCPPSVLLTARDQDQFIADWARADRVLQKPVDGFAVARLVRELTSDTQAPTQA